MASDIINLPCVMMFPWELLQSRGPSGHIRVLWPGRGDGWQPQARPYACPSISSIRLFLSYSLRHNRSIFLSSGSSFSKLSNLIGKGRAVNFPTLQSSWTQAWGAWAPCTMTSICVQVGPLYLWTLMFTPSTRPPDLPPKKPVCRSRSNS